MIEMPNIVCPQCKAYIKQRDSRSEIIFEHLVHQDKHHIYAAFDNVNYELIGAYYTSETWNQEDGTDLCYFLRKPQQMIFKVKDCSFKENVKPPPPSFLQRFFDHIYNQYQVYDNKVSKLSHFI